MLNMRNSRYSQYLHQLVRDRLREESFYKQYLIMKRSSSEIEDLQESYARRKGRRPGDTFGDRSKLKSFITRSQAFDYDRFDANDWNNFIFISERIDFDRSFQRKITQIARKHLGEHSELYKRILKDSRQRK